MEKTRALVGKRIFFFEKVFWMQGAFILYNYDGLL